MTTALAQELFLRQLQRLVFLPEVTLREYTDFLSLLAMPPQSSSAAGGVAGMLEKSGIRTIMVNEIDITAVFTRRNIGESANETADGADTREEFAADLAQSRGTPSDHVQELSIEELLSAMSAEPDDGRYQQLSRVLLAKGRSLKPPEDSDRLLMILSAMAEQGAAQEAGQLRRQSAGLVLHQLALGDTAEHLLDLLEDEDYSGKEPLYLIFKQLGAEVVEPVIGRLLMVGGKPSRVQLMTALAAIGPPAQPALVALLADHRWQVVHTVATILGAIGSRESVKDLALTAFHSDSRVRAESIRSLARIGGMEATAVLVSLLADESKSIAIQAITWLGNSRNQAAVKPLLQLIMKRDFLGKCHPLKKEAVLAIGRIGDRRALEPMSRLVGKRFLIGAARWDELKLLSVEAIGQLGGESARGFLQDLTGRDDRLGEASRAVLASLAPRCADHE